MLLEPKGDLLTLIWMEEKLLPPDQASVGLVLLTTCPPLGEFDVGATGAGADDTGVTQTPFCKTSGDTQFVKAVVFGTIAIGRLFEHEVPPTAVQTRT